MRSLPEELQAFAGVIEATRRPIISIGFEDAPPADLVTSRIGGMPWWPAARPFPTDGKGVPLLLLAQINFAETPVLDPFPRRGLLQIFIGTDDLYGCNFDAPTLARGFLAVYHPVFEGAHHESHPLAGNIGSIYSPLEDPLTARALSFAVSSMTIDPGDYRFEKLLPEIAGDDDLAELYFNSLQAPALRMGGYPSFTQEDPRAYLGADALGEFSLLTVDTAEGIMWGDSGVAQFFMHEADIIARDFSKVAYNWDCC